MRNDFVVPQTVTVADRRRVSDLWLLPGDILIERSNTRELVGTARLYKGDADFAIFPDLLIRVRVNAEALPEYVEIALHEQTARNYFTSAAQGSQGSMPKIDQQIILDFPLKLPSIEEQKEIVRRVALFQECASIIESHVTLARGHVDGLTQSLFAKAFRGELVPTEAELARREGRDCEPASVLLERIRADRAKAKIVPAPKRIVKEASAHV